MIIAHIGLWFSGALALFALWMLWDMFHKAPLDPPWGEEDEAKRQADLEGIFEDWSNDHAENIRRIEGGE